MQLYSSSVVRDLRLHSKSIAGNTGQVSGKPETGSGSVHAWPVAALYAAEATIEYSIYFIRTTRKLSNRTQCSTSFGAPAADKQKPLSMEFLRTAE